MSGEAESPRTPLAIGDPSRRLGTRGALVVIGLVVALILTVRAGFDWVIARSDEWSLASARRVVATSALPEATRAGLDAELDRLAAAHEAGTVPYDALFATLQRVVEGPLVAVALIDRAARAEGLPPADAAGLLRIARSLEAQDFVPEHVEPLVEALQAGRAPSELGAPLATALAGEPAPDAADPAPPEVDEPFDAVATFRAVVDGTLAGNPPPRYAPR